MHLRPAPRPGGAGAPLDARSLKSFRQASLAGTTRTGTMYRGVPRAMIMNDEDMKRRRGDGTSEVEVMRCRALSSRASLSRLPAAWLPTLPATLDCAGRRVFSVFCFLQLSVDRPPCWGSEPLSK